MELRNNNAVASQYQLNDESSGEDYVNGQNIYFISKIHVL